MNNCLVTKLKASVNNEDLSKLNVLTIKTKASDSPTTATQWFDIAASENGPISINSPSVGLYKSGISGELHSYPLIIPANLNISSYFENKDGIIEVTGKYNINNIRLGDNASVRIKEIYGIPGTITSLILRNVEEGVIDVAKLKNALNIGGLTTIEVPLNANIINKLNKNTLSEFTRIGSIFDGTSMLFEGGLVLDDLANVTTLKAIIVHFTKEGNLSSLAKLTNLTRIYLFDTAQHKGDIMDFINPWIQAGRTSGKIQTAWIDSQHNITLNGQPITYPEGVKYDSIYLNWTSDGTVTFTKS